MAAFCHLGLHLYSLLFRASPPMSKVMSSTLDLCPFFFCLYTSRGSSNANPSITFCAVVTPLFYCSTRQYFRCAHYDLDISMFARYDLDTYSSYHNKNYHYCFFGFTSHQSRIYFKARFSNHPANNRSMHRDKYNICTVIFTYNTDCTTIYMQHA